MPDDTRIRKVERLKEVTPGAADFLLEPSDQTRDLAPAGRRHPDFAKLKMVTKATGGDSLSSSRPWHQIRELPAAAGQRHDDYNKVEGGDQGHHRGTLFPIFVTSRLLFAYRKVFL